MATSLGLPPVEIDIRAQVPAYQQLANWLRARIADGTWAPDEQIPSIKQLREMTGLADGTVRKAVDVLRKEELVYSVNGRGTFVARR